MQFSEIIGQAQVKQKLLQTVQENRISHAQLFAGPGGSGKLALAIAYAQYINCSHRSGNDSCGVCPSCRQFAGLAHPDLHFSYPIIISREKKKLISKDYIGQWRDYLFEKHFFADLNEWYRKMETEKKQGVIGVDECNEIIRTLSYKSYEGKYKVMIIWMAERLYHSAAPKILKILEEPPDRTLFILIAEKPDQLPLTILSRTQMVKVPPLDPDSMSAILTGHFGYPPDKTGRAVSYSGGNVNLAVEMLEETTGGDFSASEFREWMLLCYGRKYKALADYVAATARASRARQKQLLTYGLNLSRNCLLHVYGLRELIRTTDNEEEAFIKKISRFLNEKNAMEYAGLFEEAIFHIDRNGNAAVIFMDLSLRVGQLLNPQVSSLSH
jgi:DNA polymerase III subunit delta'